MKRYPANFPTDTPHNYPTAEVKELFTAILKLKTTDEAARFFRDLLTMAEITEFANRWQMVKLLIKGYSYATIAQKLKVSTATVTRVAHWFYQGMNGYKLVANRLFTGNLTKSSKKSFKLRGKYSFLKRP